jgi:uncharacterized protein YodC (DUF2158 family)
MKFSKGDVVRLKSGGPYMTVRFVPDEELQKQDAQLACVWWQENGDDNGICYEDFDECVLIKVEM